MLRPGHRRRLAPVVVLGVLALAGAVALSLLVGSNPIPAATVWDTLAHGATGPEPTVIRTQRLPRTLVGLAVGLALGAAGALMQGHTRNPLAEPGLFGVSAGASFAVVLVSFTLGSDSPGGIVAAALVGSLCATLLVVALATAGRAASGPVTLAVTGATLSALLTACTTAVVLLDKQSLDVLRHWATGSLQRPTESVGLVLALIGAGLVLALLNAPGVTALGLGEDVARALGNRVARVRAVGVAAITLLAAAATAACGPIAFVGLVAPHALRPFTGPQYTRLVPLAAVAGGALVLVCDVLGRVALPAGELPVGLVTAVVGAPVLVAVVARRRLARL